MIRIINNVNIIVFFGPGEGLELKYLIILCSLYTGQREKNLILENYVFVLKQIKMILQSSDLQVITKGVD